MELIRLILVFVMTVTFASADEYRIDDATVSSTFTTTRAPITQFPAYMYSVAHPGLWIADANYWYETYVSLFTFLTAKGYDVVNNHSLLNPFIGPLLNNYRFQEESDNKQAQHELYERLVMDYALPKIEEKYLGKDLKTLDQTQWQEMIIDIQAQFRPYFIVPDYKPGYRKQELVVFGVVIQEGGFREYLTVHRPELLPAWEMIVAKWRTLTIDEFHAASFTPDEQRLLDEYVYVPPSWKGIPNRMKQFVTKLANQLNASQDPIETAAYAHMELVKIHPFEDANGRTARTIMNMILMQAGYQPVVFLRESTYAQAVTRDAKAPGTFACYLRKKVMQIDELPVEANPYAMMAELERNPDTVSTLLKEHFKEHSQDPHDHLCDEEDPLLCAI